MTNVIDVDFGRDIAEVQHSEVEIRPLVQSILNHLRVLADGKELCRYCDDVSVKNNRQYLDSWLEEYLQKYYGEEDAIRLLLPRLKEHLACF